LPASRPCCERSGAQAAPQPQPYNVPCLILGPRTGDLLAVLAGEQVLLRAHGDDAVRADHVAGRGRHQPARQEHVRAAGLEQREHLRAARPPPALFDDTT